MNARPVKQDDERRTIPVKFWVSPKEHEEIQQLQSTSGCSNLSEYLRQVALGYKQADREKNGL